MKWVLTIVLLIMLSKSIVVGVAMFGNSLSAKEHQIAVRETENEVHRALDLNKKLTIE